MMFSNERIQMSLYVRNEILPVLPPLVHHSHLRHIKCSPTFDFRLIPPPHIFRNEGIPPVLLFVRTESADAVGGWLDIRGCRRSWTSYGLNRVTDFCWKKSLMMFVALLSELRAESLSRERSLALIQFIRMLTEKMCLCAGS